MSERFLTLKDRIAQAIYVLGTIGAAFWLFFFVVGVVFLILGIRGEPDLPILTVMYLVGVFCSYGVGWGIRWIINGTSSSVLDYLGRV